jgi:ABC-type uncharacterized transport system involved in gliding motility auxiliary subunit
MANVRNLNQFSSDMNAGRKELERIFNSKLPDHAEAFAQDIVDRSFANEQYQDGGKSTKWQGRKKDKEGKKQRTERKALLVQSREMQNQTIATQARSIGDRSHEIVITSSKQVGEWNLGQIHNEGLDPVPQRQFMPMEGEENPELTRQIQTFMDDQMDRIFK